VPGTPQERSVLVRQILDNVTAVDFLVGRRWDDGTEITTADLDHVMALTLYEASRRKRTRSKSQRRAMRLLRSLLSPGQLENLRKRESIRVIGSEGGVYRLYPKTGRAEFLERHGKREYGMRSYCLHEPPGDPPLPPADRTIAHLLMLTADEPSFLATANKTESRPMGWDSEWQKRRWKIRMELAASEAMAAVA
jgi:hypothetical protein